MEVYKLESFLYSGNYESVAKYIVESHDQLEHMLENLKKKCASLGYIQESMGGAIKSLESKLQRDREESMCDMCKMFEQLSTAHNALCDAVRDAIGLLGLREAQSDAIFEQRAKKLAVAKQNITNARLPQDTSVLPSLKREDETDVLAKHGLQEAQDEPHDQWVFCDESGRRWVFRKPLGVADSDLGDSVDAIMGELAQSFDKIVVDVAEQNKWCDSAVKELCWMVRPHIDRLVGEIAYQKKVRGDIEHTNLVFNELSKAKERAEAELADVLKANNELIKNGVQCCSKEKKAMKECVDVLRDYDHDLNCWLSDRKQALSKLDEAQKGGE